jgi:hypothetical protein
VLITHGGPYGILDLVQEDPFSQYQRDLHQGCEELNKKVFQLPNLKVSCFGHLHNQKIQTVTLKDITFINAAMVNDNHKICHLPVVIDI